MLSLKRIIHSDSHGQATNFQHQYPPPKKQQGEIFERLLQ